jgi:hypothetical protein
MRLLRVHSLPEQRHYEMVSAGGKDGVFYGLTYRESTYWGLTPQLIFLHFT